MIYRLKILILLVGYVLLSLNASRASQSRFICINDLILKTDEEITQLQKTYPQSISENLITLIPPSSVSNFKFNEFEGRIFQFRLDDGSVIFTKLQHQFGHLEDDVYTQYSSLDKFKEYLKSIGQNPDFRPLGSGGTRVSLDDINSNLAWKHYSGAWDAAEAANFCAREQIITDFTNRFFSKVENEIGISLEVVPHDYTHFEKTGWVSQPKVHGITLDQYRKSLPPEKLIKYLNKERLLKNKIKEANLAAGKMQNRQINRNWHMIKVSSEDMGEVNKLKNAFPSGDLYVETMADRGHLADVDLGLLRGDVDDLNNCLVTGTKIVNGDEIPLIKCFDI